MLKKSFIFSIALLSIVHCANGYATRPGFIFQSFTLNKDVSTATDLGSKEGKACASSILGWFTNGEAGIQHASENGGIKKVKAVDYSSFNFLGLYSDVCTIARGD